MATTAKAYSALTSIGSARSHLRAEHSALKMVFEDWEGG